jgi:hypothetical protein
MKKTQLLNLLKLNDIKQRKKKKPTKPKKKKILNKELRNFIPKIDYEGRANGELLFI